MDHELKGSVLVSTTDHLLPNEPTGTGENRPTSSTAKWRRVIQLNLGLVIVVLGANVGLFAWAWTRPSHEGGVSTAFSGSCIVMSRISVWSHLAINILSTILLSAGNYCVQCLIAPTRPELDVAHGRTRWLDIGVISLRNFKASSGRNKALILLISLSSMPLHLIYNSVIVGTPSANEYMALLVSKEFLTGTSWQDYNTNYEQEAINGPEVQYLQDHIGSLVRLENAECMSAYSHTLVSDWSNVLLVSDVQQTTHPIIEGFNIYPTSSSSSSNNAPGWAVNSDGSLQDPNAWVRYEPVCNGTAARDFKFFCDGQDGGTVAVKIEYCLAQAFEPKCSIKISTTFLAVILVCNFVKILCILATLSASAFQPLLTLGDAICSFLEYPDSTTRDLGPISADDVTGLSRGNSTRNGHSELQTARPWKTTKRRWFAGASGRRWALTVGCCVLAWIVCIAVLVLAVNWGAVWDKGLGVVDPNSLVSISAGHGLATNTLLANLPQLVISLLYVLYNGMFTAMLLTNEFCDFSSRRKGLRVSNKPMGEQRSTYWLQLPFRYALPLMALMSVLHWLVSQSIFLVRVNVYDNNGINVPDRDISACGYSMYGLVASLICGSVFIVALILCGFQRLSHGAPIVRSCSLAISAAVHGKAEEATAPLMYGALTGEHAGYEQDGSARKRAGFGAYDVQPLIDGEIY